MNDYFTWCPLVAVLLGALSTLGFFRSRRWGAAAIAIALLVQVVGWTFFFLAVDIQREGWTKDWQIALSDGFLRALIGVVPYTVIGAACGSVLVALVRFSVREEVDQVEETKEEAAEREADHQMTASGRGWD